MQMLTLPIIRKIALVLFYFNPFGAEHNRCGGNLLQQLGEHVRADAADPAIDDTAIAKGIVHYCGQNISPFTRHFCCCKFI